ncbi:MAG: protein kinase [Labilithrix sp.]|nr:protein kinase [Labilithrix sp.]
MLIDHVIGGKYRITELIGQGGMGTVFEAVHTGTGSRVAIKLIVSNDIKEEVFVRFQREARAAGTIDSHHIVRIFDMGTDERTRSPYMVMERLYGEDLSQLMRRVGPLMPQAAVALAAQAALGLAKAHESSIVHRDIKPANLFLHDGGDAGEVVVKLLDFGIAKVLMDAMQRAEEGGLTRTGSMLGSPHYMSPEQAQGLRTIDHRSDIWSLGVVLYKMLAGQTPHAHVQTLGQVILAICSQAPRPVQELAPWVPPEVARIVHRALQHDPNQRFQSAHEMYAALQPLIAGLPPIKRAEVVPLSMMARSQVAQPLMSFRPDVPTHGGTDAGVSQTQGATPAKKGNGVAIAMASLGVMAALGLAGIGAAVMAKKPAAAAQPAPLTPTTVTAAAPTSEPADPTAPPSVPAVIATGRVVSVAIAAPSGAIVEVDGEKRELVDGAITLKGPLGSVAQVKVKANGAETTTPVAITEGGAMPPKIATPSTTAAPTPNTRPGGKTGGAPATPVKPAPSGTGTTLNAQRTFE